MFSNLSGSNPWKLLDGNKSINEDYAHRRDLAYYVSIKSWLKIKNLEIGKKIHFNMNILHAYLLPVLMNHLEAKYVSMSY